MKKGSSGLALAKIATAAMLVAGFGAASAATVDLTGKGYVTYGDANSYSLPINNLEVMSGPGQIDVFVKLGLGANGQLDNSNTSMDQAFDTPQANTIDGFRMTAANEPTNTNPLWDRTGWWDASLGGINTKVNLNQNSLVFFFANNEIGGGGRLETGDRASLAGWARVELTGPGNALLGRFDLTNRDSNYGPPPVGGGVPMGNVAAYASDNSQPTFNANGTTDFLESGSCVGITASGALVTCSDPTAVRKVEHNLGGDRAAYAIVFPELDALIAGLVASGADLSQYALHVDYRLGCNSDPSNPNRDDYSAFRAAEGTAPQATRGGCEDQYALNGGDEKVFIGTQAVNIMLVPEPGALGLTGLALAGIGALRARAGKRA